MKQKDRFRAAEKYLYEYKKNLACLDVLRDDLRVEEAGSSVHAQNYQLTFNFSGAPSDPVYARLIKIEGLKNRIKQLERWTRPITQLIKDLSAPENLEESENAFMLEILKLMYFGKNKPKVICDELKLGEQTFFRRRRELVLMAASYLGL